MIKSYLFIVPLVLLMLGCSKEEIDPLSADEQFKIMTECNDAAFETKEEIQNRLPGKWVLVAYACGFCADPPQPLSEINLKESIGNLKFEIEGEESVNLDFTWTIVETINIFGEPTFQLETKPSHYALRTEIFCQDYMYFNQTPVDGPMMIYKRKD